MLGTKDLVFRKKPARKLVDWYIGLYIIKEVVSTNAAKATNFNEDSFSYKCKSSSKV